MQDYHVVEEANDHDAIRLWGLYFNCFDEEEKGVGREETSEFPCLLMLIQLWPDDRKTKLKRMNHKVDEYNGKVMGTENVRYRNVCRFSMNEFWNNIGCIIIAPTFGLGDQGCGRRKRI